MVPARHRPSGALVPGRDHPPPPEEARMGTLLTLAGVAAIVVAAATGWNLLALITGIGLLWAGLAL